LSSVGFTVSGVSDVVYSAGAGTDGSALPNPAGTSSVHADTPVTSSPPDSTSGLFSTPYFIGGVAGGVVLLAGVAGACLWKARRLTVPRREPAGACPVANLHSVLTEPDSTVAPEMFGRAPSEPRPLRDELLGVTPEPPDGVCVGGLEGELGDVWEGLPRAAHSARAALGGAAALGPQSAMLHAELAALLQGEGGACSSGDVPERREAGAVLPGQRNHPAASAGSSREEGGGRCGQGSVAKGAVGVGGWKMSTSAAKLQGEMEQEDARLAPPLSEGDVARETCGRTSPHAEAAALRDADRALTPQQQVASNVGLFDHLLSAVSHGEAASAPPLFESFEGLLVDFEQLRVETRSIASGAFKSVFRAEWRRAGTSPLSLSRRTLESEREARRGTYTERELKSNPSPSLAF